MSAEKNKPSMSTMIHQLACDLRDSPEIQMAGHPEVYVRVDEGLAKDIEQVLRTVAGLEGEIDPPKPEEKKSEIILPPSMTGLL